MLLINLSSRVIDWGCITSAIDDNFQRSCQMKPTSSCHHESGRQSYCTLISNSKHCYHILYIVQMFNSFWEWFFLNICKLICSLTQRRQALWEEKFDVAMLVTLLVTWDNLSQRWLSGLGTSATKIPSKAKIQTVSFHCVLISFTRTQQRPDWWSDAHNMM